MLSAIRIFLRAEGSKKWFVLLCILLAGLAEGIGIASLLPLVIVLGDQSSQQESAFARGLLELFGTLGIPPSLGPVLAIIVLGILLKAALTILAMRFVGYAVVEVTTRFRFGFLRRLLESEWSYFTKYRTGVLTSLIGGQAQQAGTAFQQATVLISRVIQCAVFVTLSFFVSWQLALAAIVVGVVMATLLRGFVRRSREAGRNRTRTANELAGILNDTFLGIRSLKAMAREDAFERLIREKIRRLRKATRDLVTSSQILPNLQEPMLILVMAAGAYVFIGRLSMPVGQVVVMGILLQRTIGVINRIQQQSQLLAQYEAAFEHLDQMVAEANAHRERHAGTRRPTLEHDIRFEKVSFAYDQKPVLSDLSLKVRTRELTLLMGASGGGKTTLIDILLGFRHPARGQVLIDGVPLDEIDIRAWRGMIGYVPQDFTLFKDTVLANVTLYEPDLDEAAAIAALRLAGAWLFVEHLPEGLETDVGAQGTRFSGGQRQRIALARALIHRPRLIILDEVTSALDREAELAICANVRALANEFTVIVISHRPAWIDFADRVHHLEGGRLVPDLSYRAAAV
jgi:ATP-binding cassette subfamily C protein